jgi:hypothetical protein
MIANRLLQRTDCEAKLRRWGCEPLAGLGKLNTAEWWHCKERGGYPFTVPIEVMAVVNSGP